jgi:hypothetical protein
MVFRRRLVIRRLALPVMNHAETGGQEASFTLGGQKETGKASLAL